MKTIKPNILYFALMITLTLSVNNAGSKETSSQESFGQKIKQVFGENHGQQFRPLPLIFAQSNSNIRDHRGKGSDRERRIKIKPVSGPIVQWLLVYEPAGSAGPMLRGGPKYRIVTTQGFLKFTLDLKASQPILTLHTYNTNGMAEDFQCHSLSFNHNIAKLNVPISLYVPDKRAYFYYRKLKPGQIGVNSVPPVGVISGPSNLKLVNWNPDRIAQRPGGIHQWVFMKPGDRRQKRISGKLSIVEGKRVIVTDKLAIYNKLADAFLVFDSSKKRLGWRKEQIR